MGEYGKCNFCKHNDLYITCPSQNPHGCGGYKANEQKIIDKSKDKGMSVADVIALINWERENG